MTAIAIVPKFHYDRKIDVVVPVAKVDPPFFNPPQRARDVGSIVESIRTEGQLELVHLVRFPNGRFQIADGTRRTTALKQLNKPFVQAFVYEGGENETTAKEVLFRLYEELNKPKMTLKSAHMAQAHLRGGPAFEPRIKNAVALANKLFDGEIPSILKEKFGPNMLSNAKATAKYCMPGQPHKGDVFTALFRKTLLWQTRMQTQQQCIAYRRQGFSAARLRNAIETNAKHVPGMGDE